MIYELQKYEVALVSVTEMFDTSTPQGMLFLQMLGSFAEFERAVINERTRNGRIARLNENKWVGGKPAFGKSGADFILGKAREFLPDLFNAGGSDTLIHFLFKIADA